MLTCRTRLATAGALAMASPPEPALPRPRRRSSVPPKPAARVAPAENLDGPDYVLSEGGTTAASAYRGWFDYYGVAIPGDTQGAPNGQPLDASAVAARRRSARERRKTTCRIRRAAGTIRRPATRRIQRLAGLRRRRRHVPDHVRRRRSRHRPVRLPADGGQSARGARRDDLQSGTPRRPTRSSTATVRLGLWRASPRSITRTVRRRAITCSAGRSSKFRFRHLAFDRLQRHRLTIPAGGVKLSRNSICGIGEGNITNWNDPSITSDNGGTTSAINRSPTSTVHEPPDTTFMLSYGLNVICAQANVQPANAWANGVGSAR